MKYKSFFIVLFLLAWLPIANLFATDYTLSVNADGCETPTSYTYSAGTTIILQAYSIDEYLIFDHWSDGNTDNPRTLVVSKDSTIEAIFTHPQMHIFATSQSGNVSGSGTYNYGDTVILKADTSSCLHFVKWSDGNTDNPRTLIVTKDSSLSAIMEANTNIYHTTIQSADSLMGKVKINTPPVISLDSILNIRDSSATFLAHIVHTGNKAITQRGFCVDIVNDPTIESGIVILDTLLLTDSFTCPAKGLMPNTTYYVRAFASNSLGTGYSETKSFTTPTRYAISPNCQECSTGTIGTAVDLGLPSGTKWADHNIGASTPEGYGCYFAWGETGVKDNYTWDNYLYCNTTTLDSVYDAAIVNWGNDWRMPTYDEQNELLTNCTWTWTTKNGVNGFNVQGPNGNSIFLPAAGNRQGASVRNAGGSGNYWSVNSGAGAWDLNFDSGLKRMFLDDQKHGFPIRPVCK